MDTVQCNAREANRFRLTVLPGKKHQLTVEAPWKIFGPLENGTPEFIPGWSDRLPSFYLTNSTAGILAGDLLEGEIRLAEKTGINLIAPAATRVFSMPGGKASQRLQFELEPESNLAYYGNQLIPYASADFEQQNDYRLDGSASLMVMEFLTPGRIGTGELFRFKQLRLRNRIFIDKRLVLDDRLYLDTGKCAVSNPGIITPERPIIGTVYLAGRLVERFCLDRPHQIPNLAFTMPHPNLIVGRAICASLQNAELALRKAIKLFYRNQT
jgi:Urease accessory protein UreH